jgi:hypothetical protein
VANPQPLFSIPEHKRSRTSDVILSLIEGTYKGDVTLRSMIERLGERTFGVLLIVMAAFNVIPFVSILTGPIISIIGIQMIIGATKIKLPLFVLDWKLSAIKVRQSLLIMEPKIRKIEKFIRPRWTFTEAPIFDRLNGIIIAALGAVIAIPIPFTNFGLALIIIVMGLGLLERDGLVQLLAFLIGVVALIIVYLLITMIST